MFLPESQLFAFKEIESLGVSGIPRFCPHKDAIPRDKCRLDQFDVVDRKMSEKD